MVNNHSNYHSSCVLNLETKKGKGAGKEVMPTESAPEAPQPPQTPPQGGGQEGGSQM